MRPFTAKTISHITHRYVFAFQLAWLNKPRLLLQNMCICISQTSHRYPAGITYDKINPAGKIDICQTSDRCLLPAASPHWVPFQAFVNEFLPRCNQLRRGERLCHLFTKFDHARQFVSHVRHVVLQYLVQMYGRRLSDICEGIYKMTTPPACLSGLPTPYYA